jgi:hypothetical protein
MEAAKKRDWENTDFSPEIEPPGKKDETPETIPAEIPRAKNVSFLDKNIAWFATLANINVLYLTVLSEKIGNNFFHIS